MSFITSTDYESSIHTEILDAITRSDDTIVEVVQEQAIAEMAGYLSARYNTTQIFSQTGTSRNNLILMLAKDITLYHLHAIHNPIKFPAIRKDRYDQAIEWLRAVRNGEINPVDLPLTTNSEGDQGGAINYAIASNEKRINHF